MKKIFSIVAVALLMTACSTPTPPPAPQPAQVMVPSNPQELNASRAVSNMPEWFMNVPKSDTKVYAVGDGVSGSLSGAISNARANAFEGICQTAGGTVRSQTKVFRQDTESSSTNITTTAIRSLCADVDVTGALVEGSKVIQEGSRFRAYVLVGLPLGDANKLARTKQADKLQEKALDARDREFKELDKAVNNGNSQESAPVTQVQGITLMNVDNDEYKRKRDEALQKPGAVIGQTIVR